MGARLNIFKGSITSLITILHCIADHFNKAEVIGNTLTPIVFFMPLADSSSHPKLVNNDITSFNTLRNQKHNFTAIINYSLLIRDNSFNSFSLVGFSTST